MGRMVSSISIIELQSRHMFIEIGRFGRAATERVHLGTGQAIKVIKLHRREGSAEVHKLLRRVIQFSTFVIRTDDKDTHVEFARRFHRHPIQIINELPMQIHIVKLVTIDRVEDDVRRGVGGETQEPNPPLSLQFPGRLDTSVFPQRKIEQLPIVDPMERE